MSFQGVILLAVCRRLGCAFVRTSLDQYTTRRTRFLIRKFQFETPNFNFLLLSQHRRIHMGSLSLCKFHGVNRVRRTFWMATLTSNLQFASVSSWNFQPNSKLNPCLDNGFWALGASMRILQPTKKFAKLDQSYGAPHYQVKWERNVSGLIKVYEGRPLVNPGSNKWTILPNSLPATLTDLFDDLHFEIQIQTLISESEFFHWTPFEQCHNSSAKIAVLLGGSNDLFPV